jgi:hypothetical protein
MSHASGQVKFKDGEVMFFEYDGTADGSMADGTLLDIARLNVMR